jgi:hypothetical protein
MKNKLSISEVYRRIDNERDYQNNRWPEPEHRHSATEYLVYIQHQVNVAFAKVSTENGETGALDQLMKIAALAVRAMEEHGAPWQIFRG